MAGQDISAGKAYVTLYAKRDPLTAGLKASGNQIAKWAVGIGASFLSLRAITNSIVDAAEHIDKIAKGADKIGITTQSFVALEHAADLAGTSIGAVEDAMAKMQKALVEGRNKGGKAAEVFTDIGLSVEDLFALTPDKQFEAIADAIASIVDPAERTAAAMKIFGKAAQDLLPLLLEGAAGIEKARKETEAYGLAISRMDAKKVEEMNDAITRLKAAWSGWTFSATAWLSGPAQDYLEFFTDVTASIHDLERAADHFWDRRFSRARTEIGAATPEEIAANLAKNQAAIDRAEKAREKLKNPPGKRTETPFQTVEAPPGRRTPIEFESLADQAKKDAEEYVAAFHNEWERQGPLPMAPTAAEEYADAFLAQFDAAEQARTGAMQSIRDGGVGGSFSARAAGQLAGSRLEQLASEQIDWLEKIKQAVDGLFPVWGA